MQHRYPKGPARGATATHDDGRHYSPAIVHFASGQPGTTGLRSESNGADRRASWDCSPCRSPFMSATRASSRASIGGAASARSIRSPVASRRYSSPCSPRWRAASPAATGRARVGVGRAADPVDRRGAVAPGRRGALGFAIVTGVFIAAYTVSDGLGARRSGTALGYIAWLFPLDGAAIPGYAVLTPGRRLGAALRVRLAAGLLGGVLSSSPTGWWSGRRRAARWPRWPHSARPA
jgi:hypothetical protein